MIRPRHFLRTALALLAVAGTPGRTARAQDSGPGTGGVAAIARAQQKVGSWKRVLMIGAHPDDEYTDLIALLSRGEGIDIAYLSLTRGEGGQNLIGSELGAALGLLRTEELLAARAVDGGRQYFTRAFDFGFSKSAEETFRFWPRRKLLEDVVRVIRTFRPQVIVSVWSGTARDGHGHHQASGIIAREAFDVAGDSSQFSELRLKPYQPAKFYLAPYTVAPNTPMLTLQGGRIEPASGLTFHQLAARSSSRHRSQGVGRLEQPGPWPVSIALTALATGIMGTPGDSLFAGVPIERPTASIEAANAARIAAAGIVVDAYADDDEVATGQSVAVTLLVANGGSDTVRAYLMPPRAAEWAAADGTCDSLFVIPPGALRQCSASLRNLGGIPDQPYFLVDKLDGAMYQWIDQRESWAGAFDRPLAATFSIRLQEQGEAVPVRVEVRGRFLEQAVGEVRHPVIRVPRVVLTLQPSRTIWRRGARGGVLQVLVEHLARDTSDVVVKLDAPPGWRVGPPQQRRFTREREQARLEFAVSPPADLRDGEVDFSARAVIGTDTVRLGIDRIDYPHVSRRAYFTYADAQVVVAPVVFPSLARAAYVRGAADLIPESLRNAGLVLRVLDDESLDTPVLDSLDVLVIGPRAYEISDGIRRAHPRVLEWVNRGGTLIVQYQQYQYVRGGFAPRPFTIASPHDRVSDENANVTMLAPTHRAFTYPNTIVAADFTGWRQERGLYFASAWDSNWTPLLSMADSGETAKRGGLLIADVGKGQVIYTGLAFFRQLPAAVPGAWRLFANLLALAERRAR